MKCKKIILLFCLTFFIFAGCTKDAKISGNQWFLGENSFTDAIRIASTSISDLFSLYLIDTIGIADFQTEISLILTQLQAAEIAFANKCAMIEVDSQSFASKRGADAISSAYQTTIKFLESSLKNESSKEELKKQYSIWRESLTRDIATYYVAKQLIEEADKKNE